MLNTAYLEQKIRETGKSKSFLADKLGIARATFYSKLKGRTQFTGGEFMALIDELGLTEKPNEVRKIFYPEVRKNKNSTEEDANAESKT